MKLDYSDYLDRQLADQQIEGWAKSYAQGKAGEIKEGVYVTQQTIAGWVAKHDIKSVVEFGPGGGYVPAGLPADVEYTGYDNCSYLLEEMRKRNPDRTFIEQDIRLVEHPVVDLVVMNAVLRHFDLIEFDAILCKLLGHGRYCAFDIQYDDHNYSDDTPFSHIWVTLDHVNQILEWCGHTIVDKVQMMLDPPSPTKGRFLFLTKETA